MGQDKHRIPDLKTRLKTGTIKQQEGENIEKIPMGKILKYQVQEQ